MVYPWYTPQYGMISYGVYHGFTTVEKCCGASMFHQVSPLTPTLRESRGPSTWRWQHGLIDVNENTIICIQLYMYYIRTYIYIYTYISIVCADKVQLCEANMQIAGLVAAAPTPPLFVDTFGILVLLRYVNMIKYVHSCCLGKSGILVSKSAGRGSWGQAEPLPKGAVRPVLWILTSGVGFAVASQEHEQSRDKLQQSTLQACQHWKAMKGISWSIIKSNDSNEKSWKAVVHRYSLCEVRESHERHEQSKLRWKSVHQFWS